MTSDAFHNFSKKLSTTLGSSWAFVGAVLIVVTWLVTGPLFHFSDTWQLTINTFTTVVTFLMVFLIQNTQNRDAKAVHLKLDELIRGVRGARNCLIHLESLTDRELEGLQQEFEQLRIKFVVNGSGHLLPGSNLVFGEKEIKDYVRPRLRG